MKKKIRRNREKNIIPPMGRQKYISFEEIIKGRDTTVRFTNDGLLYAVELVMAVTGKDRNHSSEVLRDLNPLFFDQKKFVVRHRSRFITLENSISLLMVMPGKIPTIIRKQFSDIIVRYLDGDGSMHNEIEKNKSIGQVESYSKYASNLMNTVGEDMAKKSHDMPQTNYVYATKSPAFPGLIKIGKTENISNRVSQLNTACAPSPHVIVAVAPSFDEGRDERTAHAFFSDSRREGEFFELADETVITFFTMHITAQYNMELAQNITRLQGTVSV